MSLFSWVGNPFVDNGTAVMLAHAYKCDPAELDTDDVETMRERLLEVYLTEAWLKALQNIFPNGVWTNPAFSKRRPEVATQLVKFLASKVEPPQESGGCICCGRRQPLHPTKEDLKSLPVDLSLSKVYVPLIGGVLNFFPDAIKGAQICANCVFAIQCSPLNFYTCNYDEKRFFVLHSNSFDFLRDWSDEALKDINHQSASGHWTGPFNEGVNNAHNAFFHIVEKVMENHDFRGDHCSVSVRLYHFDNYNQPKSQPLKIYDMPAPVFNFLWEAKNSGLNEQWRKLVKRNFYFVKGRQRIPLPSTDTDEERFKTAKNLILEKLLHGDSIISNFFRRRQTLASWELLTLYLREVRFMADERTETIKRVADDIERLIRENQKKKRLFDLETASNYLSFRNVLRLIVKEWLEHEKSKVPSGNSKPLFTYDGYVDQLFPQGSLNWRETQDLILFRLYERLHDMLLPEDLPGADESDDELLMIEDEDLENLNQTGASTHD
jgi:CRISPR-associated protein Cst1